MHFYNQAISSTKKVDGYIGIVRMKIGDKSISYFYVPHTSESYGFSVELTKDWTFDNIMLNATAYGLWDSVDECVSNFKRYRDAKGNEAILTAILPVQTRLVHNVVGAVINPTYDKDSVEFYNNDCDPFAK